MNRGTFVTGIHALSIRLASTEQIIRSWSSGEVTKADTINYRTLKPEPGGLFCERIFGPTKDGECYCGKCKSAHYKGIVCERCGVLCTTSKVRRERMGHVLLAAPVAHIWYAGRRRGAISELLDLRADELDRVLYFSTSIVTWIDEAARARDIGELRGNVTLARAAIDRERDRAIAEYRNSETRRLRFVATGSRAEFTELDHLWADALGGRPAAPDEAWRLGVAADLSASADADVNDETLAAETARERLRAAWELFETMTPKDVVNDETTFRELKDRFGSPYGFGEYFRGGMGAEAVRDLLQQIDLDEEAADLQDQIKTAKGQKQARAVKRLKVVSAFIHSGNKPEMMILEAVPVIPPELRPMVQLDGGRFATSDLNDLYRRVINRNNRLKRLLDLGAPEIIVNNEKRMLQEAVDALFDNGRRGRPVTGPGNRPLRSLSDMLKGKQGRFRQNLLGKRVDYSGRSVIVAGPSLRLHQCGLPKLMALELFKPFVVAGLIERQYTEDVAPKDEPAESKPADMESPRRLPAERIKKAKKMVDSMSPEVWDVLEEVIHDHPVLLNRAPTLHRLGIQAFEPVLVEGKAIQVHPLVCHAFNADFDGDQMAVHVPLSAEAQAEARILMLSSNNIVSPAHGAPLATPTQDMVLGVYYLTYGPDASELEKIDPARLDARPHVYRTAQEAERAYEHGVVKLHDLAEYRPLGLEGGHVLTTVGRMIYHVRIERALKDALGDRFDPNAYEFINRSMKKKDTTKLVADLVQAYGTPTVSQVLDAFKDIGFHYATQAGVTISKNDVQTPPSKAEILDRYDRELPTIEAQYDAGEVTQEERHAAVTELWDRAATEVGEALYDHLDELNPIYMMANSGARGSFSQIRQLAGMRGLMADAKGRTVEHPIKSSFIEGLSPTEYFISAHGARKGQVDTALRTARAGYLTRRLVDAAHGYVVRAQDCGTTSHISMPFFEGDGRQPSSAAVGRVLALDLMLGGSVVALAGTLLTRESLARLGDARSMQPGTNPTLAVRSVLMCESPSGVCSICYGVAPATGRMAALGDAVGVIAAQSIGEPGTQLTLRTLQEGGVATADIVQGLPLVERLLEARDADLQDALRQGGPEGAAHYLVEAISTEYRKHGAEIDVRHIELIARAMLDRVEVTDASDTGLEQGASVRRAELRRENDAAVAKGGRAAEARDLLLGVRRVAQETDSFLAAAAFERTTQVLATAALEHRVDRLEGLKECVIVGRLIPAGSGLLATLAESGRTPERVLDEPQECP